MKRTIPVGGVFCVVHTVDVSTAECAAEDLQFSVISDRRHHQTSVVVVGRTLRLR